MIFNFLIFLILFLISWYLNKLFIPIFKTNWSISPNNRTSHKLPTPFGGGLIFSFLTILGSLFYKIYTPLIFIPLILIGHVDDCKGVSPLKRFFVQIGTALILIGYQSNNDLSNYFYFEDINFLYKFIIFLLLLFVFTAIVNITNFADGIDGLVASSFIIIFFTAYIKLSHQEHLLLILGALMGFLYWNWHPSKIFMGDSGSYFLGALYFNIIINIGNIDQSIYFLLLGTPLFGDITITLIRRLIIGESIFKPHKLNLYQRLNQAGINHSKVSLIYLFCTSLLCLSYIFGGIYFLIISEFIVIFIGFLLDKYIAISFEKSLLNSRNQSS